ncbi:MAG: cation:proton antiporter [Acidimicrobiales bacterium]
MDAVDGFALVALVLTGAALAAGIVERAPLSFPMLFLGLGLLLGGPLDLLTLTPESDVLEVMATFTLALVLFLDAVTLEVDEVRGDWLVPALALGPGTLLTVLGVAGAASWLLGLELVPALLIGAVLASTDPVVLRDVLRDRRIPRSVRRALSVEAGTNDLVVLPTILVLVAVATEEAGSAAEWAMFALQLLVLGPAAGAAVGAAGSWLIDKADERYSVRREYQALYGIGLVLGAFAAGHAVGGDGFLAAFAAGAAVTLLNRRLCDCFMEFGQVVAEMAMLAAFVLFGATLVGLFDEVRVGAALALAGVAIVVVRPLAITIVLRIERAGLSREARRFIAWFGPRGLNSLLFGLLVFDHGVADGERLFAIIGVVVIVSVVLHGVSATPLTSSYARRVATDTLAEERVSTASGLFVGDEHEVPRISAGHLADRLAPPTPADDRPVVIDVRSRSGHARDRFQVPGAVRVVPDDVVARATEWRATNAPHHPIVLYCN